MPGQVHFFLMQPEGPARDFGLERYSKETRRLYGVLDKQLTGRDFVATRASRASPISPSWAGPGGTSGTRWTFADFPAVGAWYARMLARPAVAKGLRGQAEPKLSPFAFDEPLRRR
jgi:GST-like protein